VHEGVSVSLRCRISLLKEVGHDIASLPLIEPPPDRGETDMSAKWIDATESPHLRILPPCPR
jgi:hypothetical protein